VDLTQEARENKLDKVIGRKNEIERLIAILNRKTKNNPALV
jgi:ATP-dependent Clp protease ATP-binding subunit ClpC